MRLWGVIIKRGEFLGGVVSKDRKRDKSFVLEMLVGHVYCLEHLLRAGFVPQLDEYEYSDSLAVFEKNDCSYVFNSYGFEKYRLNFYITPDDYCL